MSNLIEKLCNKYELSISVEKKVFPFAVEKDF